MLLKPISPFKELGDYERKVIFSLIQALNFSAIKNYREEETTQAIIDLIDHGYIKVNSDNQKYWLEIYDLSAKKYERM